MELYIQIENNSPINHPAIKENLMQAFGDVPSDWEPFVRVEKPLAGDETDDRKFLILDSQEPTYEKVDGVWTDVWVVREMTDEEKALKEEFLENRPDAVNPPHIPVTTP